MEWKHPSKILTALIDVGQATFFDVIKFQKELDVLGVKHIQIRQVENIEISFIFQLLTSLLNTRLKSIELILPYSEEYVAVSKALKECNPKLLLVYFFDSPFIKTIVEPNQPRLVLTNDKVDTLFIERSPNPKYFAVNIQSFTESQKHHTFYNRKIFIDKNGQLKNSLFNTKCFGHIDGINIHSIVDTKEFQEFWFVEKDKTAVCKDCEFRYMCTDQRVPKKSEHGWLHDKQCRYNPYQAKWEWEQGYEMPLTKFRANYED